VTTEASRAGARARYRGLDLRKSCFEEHAALVREFKRAGFCPGAEDSLLLVVIDHPASIVDLSSLGHEYKPQEVGIRVFVTARFGCDVMKVHDAKLNGTFDLDARAGALSCAVPTPDARRSSQIAASISAGVWCRQDSGDGSDRPGQ
jgi:hypothetical protein